jgi:hypothetical protein
MNEAVSGTMQYMNQGLAVVLLIAGIYFAMKVGTWTATNVVLPIKDAHIRYMSEQAETAQQNATTMQTQTEILKGLQADIAFIKTHVGRSKFEAQA